MIFTKNTFPVFFTFFLISSLSCSDFGNVKNNKSAETPDDTLVMKPETETSNRSPLYHSNDLGNTWIKSGQGLPANAEMSFLEKFENEIVAATDNVGVFISQNNVTTWKDIGKDLPSKKINALHISNNEIFVAPYRKGIFKSKNQGETWEELTFDLPNLRVNAILKNKDQLIVGNDIGIFKLDFKQNKWLRKFNAVQVVSMNQSNGKMVAGTNQGTLFSDDLGENWKWIHRQGAAHNTAILDGKIIIMNVSNDTFISNDWGKTWEELNYSPKKASYIYESTFKNGKFILSNNYGVHRSTIDEKTFELIFENEEYGFFDFLIFEEKIYGATRTWNENRGRRK